MKVLRVPGEFWLIPIATRALRQERCTEIRRLWFLAGVGDLSLLRGRSARTEPTITYLVSFIQKLREFIFADDSIPLQSSAVANSASEQRLKITLVYGFSKKVKIGSRFSQCD
ncbi:hypothetical protein C1894_02670 [Pseudomonas sp. FW305-3-2-15-E-TSA2]|nr:hypothetical protein C1895_00430 [Pseudomonas sp. FW305-3-2-15-E-TSA4]POA44901.1 hypothetical protein C1894_02670 [Pseudomonas sp. FW305-3-2-15-E-TSA2]